MTKMIGQSKKVCINLDSSADDDEEEDLDHMPTNDNCIVNKYDAVERRLSAIERNESMFMRTQDNINMTNLGLNQNENMLDQISDGKFDHRAEKFTSKTHSAQITSVKHQEENKHAVEDLDIDNPQHDEHLSFDKSIPN